MRVGLVADTLSVQEGTGIARYTQELLLGLTKMGLHVEPIVPPARRLPLGVTVNHAMGIPRELLRRASSLDLIHATSPITALGFPLLDKPKVVTYFDLLSLLCDNTSSAFHTRLFAPLFLRVGKFADRIIAISSQTKEEMISHLGISAEKISMVSPGIADKFEPRSGGERESHVIGYLGTFSRRKALPYLIRAVSILRANHPEVSAKLVICGRRNLEYNRLVQLAAELGLSEVIEFKGSLTDDQLVDTYNSFDVFVLPSEWEGFGLPILEAQRCGVPVITREDAHIPQEVSKCCLKASSEKDMANRIYELLTDANLRQAIIEEAMEHSRQFTWETTVEKTLKVYEEARSRSEGVTAPFEKD